MALKNLKPMEDVPKAVSARFAKTNSALAKKAAAKRDRSGKKVTTGKAKSIAREKKYGTPSSKTAKQNDTFVNRYAKDAKKSGSTLKGNPELAKTVAPKSVSPRQKTVPVKPKGGRGVRGGMGLGGGGALRSYNR